MSAVFDPNRFRREFPFLKNVAYLDNASDGPLPQSSLKAVIQYYKNLTLEKIPQGHIHQFEPLADARRLAARLIGAQPEEIAVTPNTSFGLNVAARGLGLKAGEVVLLSDIEFPATVYPWMNLRRNGVKIKFIRSQNGSISLDSIAQEIDQRTRVLALSFVQYFNGYKYDLEAIGRICQEKGVVFVVDGMQGVGNQVLDVKKCKIDFLSCGSGKWLLSTPGSGFFYISEKLRPKIKTVFFGWLGVDWKEHFEDLRHYDKAPFPSARKFEIGTYPYAELQILASSLKLLHQVGIKNIERHTRKLLDILIDYLQDSNYRINSILEPKHRSAIFSFTCRNAADLHRKLFQKRIICSFREKSLRIAPHFYNTEQDIHKLIGILGRNQP
jgi:selenocysteine lyase/cysteine desulfurase